MRPRKRSAFWIVTTHVITSGVALLLLLGAIAFLIVLLGRGGATNLFSPAAAEIALDLALFSFCTWLGTAYSLRYLRKNALVERPVSCIVPSIATFGSLSLVALFLTAYLRGRAGTLTLPRMVLPMIDALLATLIFAYMTRRHFSQLPTAEVRGFQVQPVVAAAVPIVGEPRADVSAQDE